MSATGPYFLNAAWISYLRALRREASPCAARAIARSRVLTFREWQLDMAVHHWASMWQYGNLSSEPLFQEWLGVNRSLNCAEGSFSLPKRPELQKGGDLAARKRRARRRGKLRASSTGRGGREGVSTAALIA